MFVQFDLTVKLKQVHRGNCGAEWIHLHILTLTGLDVSITIVGVSNLNFEVMQVVEDVLGLKPQKVVPGLQARDFLGWDSLNCVKIMMAIEAKFKIRFTLSEISRIQYLEDLFAMVAGKI